MTSSKHSLCGIRELRREGPVGMDFRWVLYMYMQASPWNSPIVAALLSNSI